MATVWLQYGNTMATLWQRYGNTMATVWQVRRISWLLAFIKKMVIVQTKQASPTPRDGWATAAKQAHDDGANKLMIDEVFADETLEDWQW